MALKRTKTLFVTDITANDATAQEKLGCIRYTFDTTNGWRKFKYTRFDNGAGNVASATNMVVYNKTTDVTGHTVTNDVSDSARNFVAGVFPVAMTDTYYGWMQVGGYNSAVRTNGDNDIAVGDTVIASSGDGTADSVAAGTASTYKPLGYCVTADDNSLVPMMITVGEY